VTDVRRSRAPRASGTPETPESSTTPETREPLNTPSTGRPDDGEFTQSRDLTPGGWDVIGQLLEEALARPASQREAFLLDACGGDRTLLEEVASLASAHDAASQGDDNSDTAVGDGGPLERIAAALNANRRRPRGDGGDADGFVNGLLDGVDTDDITRDSGGDGDRSVAGQRIGPYALVREIGRGGMGVVYLARRVDGQYDRDVALKLLRTAAYDARRRERFLAERQFLAMLSHPHIARMFDGGVTAAGQPFFTMEYIEGVRLDRYCDEQRATIPQRIRLFLQVCDAVSAAHRSLVVHRDLKPNNVLVTRDGATKLLDFGIATVLDSPEYRAENDTHADSDRDRDPHLRLCTPAYASPEQIRGGAVTAASDVYSLGAVLSELLTGVKPHRDPAPEESGRSGARRALAGDLDAIVRKAMHDDPARRYASVDLLREDLERHLEHRPVSALPGGVVYRTRKFIRRHRAAVAACLLIVLSAAAALTVTLVQSSRARAHQAAAVAEAAMRSKYDAAMALHHKGDITQAATFFREAVEHGRRIPHVVNTTRVDSVLQLARLLHLFERSPKTAEPLYREAVILARSLHKSDHVTLASAINEHAQVLADLDRLRDAETLGREALEMWRRLDGGRSANGLASAQMLADVIGRLGRDDEAEALFREALSLGLESLRDPHPHLIGLHGALAVFLERQQRVREAAPLRQAALRMALALYGETHPLVARAFTGMGDHHIAAGAFVEAEQAYRRAVTARQNVHPAPHWRIAEARSKVGYALLRQRRYQDAEALLTESYTRLSTDKGAIPESTNRARAWLVELYEAWDRPRDAARYRAQDPAGDGAPRRVASAHGPR
jgi:tetratricopeptide (TPR) repeat protein/predicted Ser/Thr protein kinase